MWLVLADAPPLAPASGSVSIFTSEPRSSAGLHRSFWVSGVGGTETSEWPGNSVGILRFPFIFLTLLVKLIVSIALTHFHRVCIVFPASTEM